MLYFFLKFTLQKLTTCINAPLKDTFFCCFLLEWLIYNIYRMLHFKKEAKLDLQINLKSFSWEE